MVIKGIFKNGVVVPEGNRNIPDGTEVRVLIDDARPLSDEIMRFAGSIKGPKDFARNHDHYIHGTPKK
ncbi:MAG TPA: antitoxin family protein [Phycisphaerae bacterium]|jgi:hypothetical protein|nr:antitoxin family protein [Phycisphaerae bacterium]